MAAQKAEGGGGSKPDFLDLDGDGNKTESMKAAASAARQRTAGPVKEKDDFLGLGDDKKSAAKQRRGRVERSIKRANKAADKFNTYALEKGTPEKYYVNGEEMTRYGMTEKELKKATRLKKRADKREAKAEKPIVTGKPFSNA